MTAPVESALPPLDDTEEIHPDEIVIDEEAPYGRKKDGTPKKKPGRNLGTANVTGIKLSEEALADKITEYIGIPVATFSPLACAVIDDRSERVAKALIMLSTSSPRLAKGLKLFIKGSAYGELIMFPAAIAIACLVDYQRLAPNAMPAQKLNITDFYMQLYGDGEPTPKMNGNNNREDVRSGLV